MSNSAIVAIDPKNKTALKRFISLERELMKNNPYYISELDGDVSKFLSGKSLLAQNMEFGLFIATKSGKDIGRCAAIINKTYQQQKQPGSGFIGFFASADGYENEVKQLIAKAESWLKERNVNKVIAPVNGGAPNAMGFLVTAFDEDPMFPFPWTAPHYPAHFEKLNYQPTYPLWYYNVDFNGEKYKKAKAKYSNYTEATIRPISKKNWDKDIETITDILNETFVHEWEFTKMSHGAMKEFFAPMKDALAAEQILIAEANGKPVGFCLAVPDLTPLFRSFNGKIGLKALFKLITGATKKFQRAGILGIGVSDEFKGKGLAKAIAMKTYTYHESLGLKSSLYFPVNEGNSKSRGFAESIGGTGRLMYQVFDKDISQ